MPWQHNNHPWEKNWPPWLLTVTKMVTASRDWAVTWAVIELWPSRDWAVIILKMPWLSCDLAVTEQSLPVISGQGHGRGQTQGQIWWSHLRPKVQSICLFFVSWESDHFWLRYSKFPIWPWKFKVKVMAKVKPDGPMWGLKFNRYVCLFVFLFCGNRTIFGQDRANSIFELENWRSR